MIDATLFGQYPTPIDMSDPRIGGCDILGIPEVACSDPSKPYKLFEVKTSLTVGDITKQLKEQEKDVFGARRVLMDVKEECVLRDVIQLRENIKKSFAEELGNFSSNVVQFVKTPICFLDLAPGDTQIRYRVFTERCLGVLEDD